MSRWLKSLLMGLGTGVFGLLLYFLSAAFEWEERLGLTLLFQQRGQVTPAPDAVVVSIDRYSTEALNFKEEPSVWPRDLHAQVIQRLHEAGAAGVVVDIFFKRPRATEDPALTAALRQAGNVILFAYLKREILSVDLQADSRGSLNIERLLPPAAGLADAAAAIAPFALPKTRSANVDHFWTFRGSAGDMPTMPAVALQLYGLDNYARLRALLLEQIPAAAQRLPPDSAGVMRQGQLARVVTQLRDLFQHHPQLAERLLARIEQLPELERRDRLKLAALVRMYHDAPRRYLNFYGPARTITTIPYVDALHGRWPKGVDLRGKMIFLGYSQKLQPEQRDNFYTVFTRDDGLDLSGVEIAATAFHNLLHSAPIRPPSAAAFIALIFAFGLVIGFIARYFSAAIAVAVVLGLAGLYLWLGAYWFAEQNLWLPTVVPLAAQLPAALLVALVWQYLDTNRERMHIRQAFGYYLPDRIVNQLAKHRSGYKPAGEIMYGICLATDAEQYTQLAESTDPQALGKFMNDYYEVLFGPVRAHGGIISDVIGDAMLAIWSGHQPDAQLREQACAAAVQIQQAVEAFNAEYPGPPLPTRIGVHAGTLLMGHVGALDHYEYRAVGDIVNTASRIQGMNKQLGTRVMVSGATLEGLEGWSARPLGRFRMAGKREPVPLYELLGRSHEVDAALHARCARFTEALTAYQEQRWQEAAAGFNAILDEEPDDGPSNFYLRECRQCLEQPPQEGWTGVVQMSKK